MKTLLALLSLALLSLARVGSAQIPQKLPPAVVSDTVRNSVTVQNDRRVPATVYLESGRFDRRLGVVPALATTTLPLPGWAVNGRTTVRLFAHVESEDLATEEFTAKPPGRIGMVIPTRSAMHAVPALDTMTAVIPPEELSEATLTVDNPRAVPVTVFAEHGNFDVRLGEVPPRSRTTLRFPKSVVSPFGSLQVFVRPSGGIDLSSDFLTVRAGDHLGLKVPPR